MTEEARRPEPARRPPRHATSLGGAIWRDLRSGGVRTVTSKTLNKARLAYQLRLYELSPRRLWRRVDSVPIDRPVFILGVQGGGVTVLARCLYRHRKVVYASGNAKFWAGPDEIHNCSHIRDLPEALVHRSYHFGNVNESVTHHPRFGYQRAWLYAVDELLSTYARRAEDADPDTTTRFRRVIRKIILAYADDPDDCRFVDMSQLYTISVPFVAEMLKGCRPHFVLVARNPYATCARAARKEYGQERGGYLASDRGARIDCAVEHWCNSYRLALEAAGSVPMLTIRYEDFLEDPEAVIREICDFAGLEFHAEQVPGPGQSLPTGSIDAEKWYPLRRAENEKYLRDIDPDLVAALNARGGDLIRTLGYEPIRGPG